MEIQRFPKVGVYAKARTLVKEKKIELYTLNADIWEEPPPKFWTFKHLWMLGAYKSNLLHPIKNL